MKIVRKIKEKTNRHFISKVSSKFKINYKNKGTINLIDVGSIGGLPEPWFSKANKVKFLLNFEPNDTVKSGDNFMTYNTAAWETNETRPFYIYKGLRGTGSSLFEQNFEYVENNFSELIKRGDHRLGNSWFERSQLVRTIDIECQTIDGIVTEHFPEKQFHFLKIDAQGAELNILKGADKVLKQCLGLHVELFNIPLYKDIALVDEVERYLEKKGFQLVKRFPPHGSFNSQNDCLFLRLNIACEKLTEIKEIYNIV